MRQLRKGLSVLSLSFALFFLVLPLASGLFYDFGPWTLDIRRSSGSLPLASSQLGHGEMEALAPVEVVAWGFKEPMGVAVDPTGAIYVSDRDRGEVVRIAGGRVYPVVTDLRGPVGLSFDREGRLLVVEEGRGRLLRLEADGRLTLLARGMRRPRWVAAREDGTVYISALGMERVGHRGRDRDRDDGEEAHGQVILRLEATGGLDVFVDGFLGLEGIAATGDSLFVAARRHREFHPRHGKRGGIFKIPILPDGRAGPVTRFTEERIKKPLGLVRDKLGALYVSAEEVERKRGHGEDRIAKVAPDGKLTPFASELEEARGLALDSSANLYTAVADGRRHWSLGHRDKHDRGYVLRFLAPPPPAVVYPQYTGRSPLTVQGKTEPDSRVDAFLNGSPISPTVADSAFALPLDLTANAEN